MTFEPIAWIFNPPHGSPEFPPITIQMVTAQDGGQTYQICQGHYVLVKLGEWEFNPNPGNRDDAFRARCRFNTFDEAADFVVQFCGEGK